MVHKDAEEYYSEAGCISAMKHRYQRKTVHFLSAFQFQFWSCNGQPVVFYSCKTAVAKAPDRL